MKQVKNSLSLAFTILLLLAGRAVSAPLRVSGDRPLLVILLEYRDRTFADANFLDHYKTKIFGPAEPNVTAYFRETSHGYFTYVAATGGDGDGTADGVIHVVMDVRQDAGPTGETFRNLALGLANAQFNYRLYDANGDGRIQDQELTVLVIQANGGDSGKTLAAGNVSYDRVSLNGLPVAVISEQAQNYVLYHELAHAVDFNGATGDDLYNLRDGFRQKALMWNVAANGGISLGAGIHGEIALELAANSFAAGGAITAYRDQNGELRLANYDFSAPDHPRMKQTASAGLATDVSIAQVSPLRVITALRSEGGHLKLIVWDVNLNWEFTRRGDYMAGEASDIEVTAVSSTRAVVACRTAERELKLIAFDISRTGELTRKGSYTAGGAEEINIVTINSTRVVTAVRQAGGNLKVICFDLSLDGNFIRRGDWEAGQVTDVDLARLSLRRVATSVRSHSGALTVILFDVDAAGEVNRLSTYEDGQVFHRAETDRAPKTSITGLAQLRLAVSYIDPHRVIQVRTLDVEDDGSLNRVGSASTLTPDPERPELTQKFASSQVVKSSGSLFATLGQVDGQIWTGNRFGMLGGHTGDHLVHFDPYTKLKLGWLPYVETRGSTLFGLAPMGHRAAQALILRVPGHRATEYFILEVRKKTSLYESGLADEGLAIWHVDEEKVYPEPFVSLEWLGGSPSTALWSEDDTSLVLYDDSSSPAGSRWSNFSTSGISISQIASFFGGLSFNVEFR